MDMLYLEHNGRTGITSIFADPSVAATLLGVGGAVGVASTLFIQKLNATLAKDPLKIVEGLKDWLMRIQKVLETVISRLKCREPREERRKVLVAGVEGAKQPDDMLEEINRYVDTQKPFSAGSYDIIIQRVEPRSYTQRGGSYYSLFELLGQTTTTPV